MECDPFLFEGDLEEERLFFGSGKPDDVGEVTLEDGEVQSGVGEFNREKTGEDGLPELLLCLVRVG